MYFFCSEVVVGKFRLNVEFKEITSLCNSPVRLIGAVVGRNGPLSFFPLWIVLMLYQWRKCSAIEMFDVIIFIHADVGCVVNATSLVSLTSLHIYCVQCIVAVNHLHKGKECHHVHLSTPGMYLVSHVKLAKDSCNFCRPFGYVDPSRPRLPFFKYVCPLPCGVSKFGYVLPFHACHWVAQSQDWILDVIHLMFVFLFRCSLYVHNPHVFVCF